MKALPVAVIVLLFSPSASPNLAVAQQTLAKGAELADYRPLNGLISGNLNIVGSDTMNNTLLLWTEEFKRYYPSVRASVDCKGSSYALPALVSGTASFGPMSREPRASEVKDFKQKFGYEPTVLAASIDMLAVYVNKDNPLDSVSLKQLDAVFSSTRNRGEARRVIRWLDINSTLDQSAARNIACYGRNAASGTNGYFKSIVLADGDYGSWVNELNGSAAVVQAVSKNPHGIGYSGIGYRTAGVKPLALIDGDEQAAVEPVPVNAYNGKYPLSRALYLTVNYDPTRPLDSTQREFVKYVFSKQGQRQVVKDGYLPVTAAMAKSALSAVGIQ